MPLNYAKRKCDAKAQLEFHLTTAITDNKNDFTNINNRRVMENVHSLLDAGENRVTKKRLRDLMPSLP